MGHVTLWLWQVVNCQGALEMLRSRVVCAIVIMMCSVCMAQQVAVQNAIGANGKSDRTTNQSTLMASLSSAEATGPGLGSPTDSSSANAAKEPAGFSSSAISVIPQAPSKAARREKKFGPFSTFAVGTKMTSLGTGVEVATPLTRSLNLRGGTNFFNLGYGFGVDGANYNFDLHLRTGQASIDWFPFHGGFHISPGVLIYKSDLSGAANVPGGNTFQLGSSSFTSSTTDPVHGNASLTFGRTLMPSLMFGWGNMIPRSGRHWSFPFEVGAAYTGHNAVHLNLQGTACMPSGCLSTSTPAIQQSILSEQNNLNESMKRLQAYPIISTGFAFRF